MQKEDKMNSEENLMADEQRILIPEGVYQVNCIRIEESNYMGSFKLYIHFKIINCKGHQNKDLYMAINMTDCKSKKHFNKVPRGSKYFEQWVIANKNKFPSMDDKMSPQLFINGNFEAVVRNVKPKFKDRTDKPECFHYSIVDYLKKRLN